MKKIILPLFINPSTEIYVNGQLISEQIYCYYEYWYVV